MADFSFNKPLKEDMAPNPIVEVSQIKLRDDFIFPDDDYLKLFFPEDKHSLKTWGRGSALELDPHWIGVKYQTPLHTDRGYPRYTHHLIVRADDFVLRGYDKTEQAVSRGTYIVVDTHSPHQLFAKTKGAAWYVGLSVDSHKVEMKTDVIMLILHYAKTALRQREIYK